MDEEARPGDDEAIPIEIRPGTILSNTYKIEKLLGRGGMGVVFEASHLRVPKRVAVKVLSSVSDRDQLARFRQEAEIASRLGHPNIVAVIDFDMLPSGTAFLVMELLEGESLAARMLAGKLPQPDAFAIIRQIASALSAAHAAGVVHRDLKPENVFLCRREHEGTIVDDVKILDFGISKVQGAAVIQTRDDVVLGTPRYMAPEQATAQHDEIDARTDQFSLAVITFEMLSGVAPFDSGNATTVMYKIVYEPTPPLGKLAPDVAAHVVAAVERGLAKSPAARFPDLSAFIEALTGKPLARDRSSAPGVPRLSQPPVVGRSEAPTIPSGRPNEPERGSPITSGTARDETALVQTARDSDMATGPEAVVGPQSPSNRTQGRARLLALVALLAVTSVAVAVAAFYPSGSVSEPAVAPSAAIDASGVAPAVVDAAVELASMIDAALPPEVSSSADHRRPVRVPPIPADVLAELTAAEEALAAGRLPDAEASARRALYNGRHHRAYQVLITIACRRRNVATAHAWMRAMSKAAWPAALAHCKAVGFPIDEPR